MLLTVVSVAGLGGKGIRYAYSSAELGPTCVLVAVLSDEDTWLCQVQSLVPHVIFCSVEQSIDQCGSIYSEPASQATNRSSADNDKSIDQH